MLRGGTVCQWGLYLEWTAAFEEATGGKDCFFDKNCVCDEDVFEDMLEKNTRHIEYCFFK